MNQLIKKYWLSIIVNIAVLTVCMIKTPQIEKLPMTNFDKLVHLLLFAGISGIVFFDNTQWLKKNISNIRLLLGSFLFPTAFGGLIEILQATLTDTRSGDVMDFAFDAVGAAVGVLICFFINKKIYFKHYK